jgi:small subunit ribosomal protein S17
MERTSGTSNKKSHYRVVASDKMDKSRTVKDERSIKHPLYRKYVKKTSKFMAHDETNESHIGDTVRIMETRPLSARKRWRVIEIVQRAE